MCDQLSATKIRTDSFLSGLMFFHRCQPGWLTPRKVNFGHWLHLQLNVQPFDKRMQYFLLCSIYRNIKNEFLTPIVPRRMTRMHRAPILPQATPNSDWFYRSAVYFGIKTWNILPINIRNSHSLDIFKASIKQYLDI